MSILPLRLYYESDYDPNKPCNEPCILNPELDFVFGCTDPNATNYDEDANRDDGSCIHAHVIPKNIIIS